MTSIVATNLIGSRLPKHQPTGMLTARNNLICYTNPSAQEKFKRQLKINSTLALAKLKFGPAQPQLVVII